MNTISTHVLDTARGCPAEGIEIRLEQESNGEFKTLGHGTTNADGRVKDLLAEGQGLQPGLYRMTFCTEPYLRSTDQDVFYPEVQVLFRVASGQQHYHIPLLLSPFGYSTYRGS